MSSNNLRIKVPDELKEFVEVENCDNFNVDRYYLTQAQVDIINAILRDMEIGEVMRNELHLDYLNTTLLYGPTGTGKTTFARYIAYYLEKDLVYINFSKMIDGIFGNTAKNISNVFRYFTSQDCIFMIDEIDAIAIKRGSESAASGGELSRITITIMQELDYCKLHQPQAVVIAATNVVDNLDPALRSRFSVEKEVPLLTNADKEGFILKYLNSIPVPYDREQIREYVARSSRITQRRMESDMLRAIAKWVEKDREGVVLLERIVND